MSVTVLAKGNSFILLGQMTVEHNKGYLYVNRLRKQQAAITTNREITAKQSSIEGITKRPGLHTASQGPGFDLWKPVASQAQIGITLVTL